MKHGDKAKSKKASKASGKKSSKASKKSSKVAHVKTKPKQAGSKAKSSKTGGNGKSRGRTDVTFTNPVIAAAFKRAVRKYPNAFRRLTD